MSCSRRDLMKGGVALLTVIGGCRVDPPPIYDAAVDDDPTSAHYGTVRLVLAELSDLLLPGRAVTVRLAPLPAVLRERPFTLPSPPELLIVRRSTGEGDAAWAAFDSSCPHAACPLGYDAERDQLACPCHGSRFRAAAVEGDLKTCAGQPLSGPARQGPRGYAANFDVAEQALRVDLTTPAGCGVTRFPPLTSGKVTISVADYAELGTVDTMLVGRPHGMANDLALVRRSSANDASAFVALDPTCTHMRCTVGWSSAGEGGPLCGQGVGGFICPCHCSRFSPAGDVQQGPADRPLKVYPLSFDGQTLVVTIA